MVILNAFKFKLRLKRQANRHHILGLLGAAGLSGTSRSWNRAGVNSNARALTKRFGAVAYSSGCRRHVPARSVQDADKGQVKTGRRKSCSLVKKCGCTSYAVENDAKVILSGTGHAIGW